MPPRKATNIGVGAKDNSLFVGAALIEGIKTDAVVADQAWMPMR